VKQGIPKQSNSKRQSASSKVIVASPHGETKCVGVRTPSFDKPISNLNQ
jgi:hypothetical protein